MANRYSNLGLKSFTMNTFFEDVWGRLEVRLSETEREPDMLRRYQAGITVIKTGIVELRAIVMQNPFENKADEVEYFRHQVPQLYSQLFFLQKLADLERYRSFVLPDKFRERLERELTDVEQFYNRHRDVAQSSPLSLSPWDEMMFTRQETSDWSALEVGVFIDAGFTIGSYIAAMMQANRALVSWLRDELDQPGKHGTSFQEVKVVWTGTLVELVELGYAMDLVGCLNGGKLTLKATMQWLGRLFGMKLDDHNSAYQDIARRKIAMTKFLDRLRDALIGKINHSIE